MVVRNKFERFVHLRKVKIYTSANDLDLFVDFSHYNHNEGHVS